MKLVGYVQLKNELRSGHLVRCLTNLNLVCDEFVIYDDGSDDGSQDLYSKYTPHIIQGPGGMFEQEAEISQQLLNYCRDELRGDWALWIDGDAIFNRAATDNEAIRHLIQKAGGLDGCDGYSIHWINTYLSPRWYRMDNRFNDLLTVGLFRLTPDLEYDITPGLHRQRFPNGIAQVWDQRQVEIIHLGFSSQKEIERKYRQYRALGQHGWALERMLATQPILTYMPDYLFPSHYQPVSESEPPEVPDWSYLRSG
jgi:hypothetical protein